MNSEKQEIGYKNKNSEEETYGGNSLIEFITTAVRYKWFLFWFVFIITASATVYALLSPKWYKSTASVLPAEKTDFLSAFSGLSAIAKNFTSSKGLAALTGNSESDRYLAILKSSTMIGDVINKFGLRKEYELENTFYEKTAKAFISNLELEVQDEGNLTITVYDKNPQKAADIANYMVKKLNEINTSLSITNAKANREFIEKRYKENVEDINHLEDSMKTFQIKYGVIAVPQQLEATVKTMATIYGELAQKEIQYNVLKRTFGESNPLTSQARIEEQELRKQISMQNSGRNISGESSKLLIPFKEAPELSNKYLKIYRDLEIQYKILEFVQPMYEQAKVEEVRDTPTVLVLDKAAPAERKSKPKASLYLVIAFIVSFSLGLFFVFTVQLLGKFKEISPEKYSYVINSLKPNFRKNK